MLKTLAGCQKLQKYELVIAMLILRDSAGRIQGDSFKIHMKTWVSNSGYPPRTIKTAIDNLSNYNFIEKTIDGLVLRPYTEWFKPSKKALILIAGLKGEK